MDGQVTADTIVSTSGDKNAPVIDADAELLKQLRDEEYALWMSVKEIRERHEKQMREEMAPVKEKIKALDKKILELGPKPACYGGPHCAGLPECGECGHVQGCIREVRSRLKGGSA